MVGGGGGGLTHVGEHRLQIREALGALGGGVLQRRLLLLPVGGEDVLVGTGNRAGREVVLDGAVAGAIGLGAHDDRAAPVGGRERRGLRRAGDGDPRRGPARVDGGSRGDSSVAIGGEKNDGWKNVGSGTFLNASGAMRGSERARWRQKGKFAHLMTSLETALGAARAFAPAPKHAGAARTIEAWLADIAMAVAIEQRGAARAVGCAAGRGGGRARDAGEGGCGEVEGLARDLYARVGDASDGVKRARAVEQ